MSSSSFLVIVAQLVRAPDCGSGGCGFKSRQSTAFHYQIFSSGSNGKVRTIPLLFFREIKVDVLIKNQNLKQISTISTRKKENNLYLEEINQLNLEELSKSDFVSQIIPIFFIPFEFINLMKFNDKNLSYNTLREFFNQSAKNNKEILAVKINKNLEFYDIDYKEDISNLESLNQD